jgi:hypothetical protein
MHAKMYLSTTWLGAKIYTSISDSYGNFIDDNLKIGYGVIESGATNGMFITIQSLYIGTLPPGNYIVQGY